MVLDDVLVNFDAVRAQRAAEVLNDFAAGGHQLLIFTCHEHMWQMFKGLDADCRRLPGRMGKALPAPEPVIEVTPEVVVEAIVEEVIEPTPKPKKKRKPKPVVIVETPAPEPVAPLFYEYPFVEKIEEVVEHQVVDVAPVPQAETTYEWTMPELPAARRHEAPAADHAIAYILDEESESTPHDGVYYERVYRDHLEPRRA